MLPQAGPDVFLARPIAQAGISAAAGANAPENRLHAPFYRPWHAAAPGEGRSTGPLLFLAARPTQRGVIYTIAPSYLDINRIWVGTDDGLIHLTTDGGLKWTDVTPPQLTAWAKVSVMDAGRFDAQTAYAAINTLRLDDMRPHIYRTHDGGKTWTHITNGIPDGAPVNVVREDSKRKGLLFGGTEREVYVSFNDGDTWQSLRLNMPASSVRDLIVKDDDIAVATHGRGFWILDNITPLRHLDAKAAGADVFLFKPQTACRVRWNMNTNTPLPPDEPRPENPPDGAVETQAALVTLRNLRASVKAAQDAAGQNPVAKAFAAYDAKAAALEGASAGGGGGRGGRGGGGGGGLRRRTG